MVWGRWLLVWTKPVQRNAHLYTWWADFSVGAMWQFPQQKPFDPAAHGGVSSVFVTCPSNKNIFSLYFLIVFIVSSSHSVPPWQGSPSLVTNHFQKGVELNLCAKKAIDFELLRSLDVVGSTFFSPRFPLQCSSSELKGLVKVQNRFIGCPAFHSWQNLGYYELWDQQKWTKGFESHKHLVSP